MSRPVRVLLILTTPVLLAACLTACGTEKIKVPSSDPTHAGAVLFSQRCSGCHTLSYAATHGSASNVRTRELTNGPNFNVRCERPVTRVLYAIENGGFSGAIMPQNVVVGHEAIAVAQFVATYAGRQATTQPGGTPCEKEPIGSIPPPTATATAGNKKANSGGSPNRQSGPTPPKTRAARSQVSGNKPTRKAR